MCSLKDNIVDQVIYYMQNFHTLGKCNGDFMHTVIYGPPGTGKTEIAKIMGKIFSKLDVLKKGSFKKVTRTDLIAGYLGQTAMKTRDVVRNCSGWGSIHRRSLRSWKCRKEGFLSPKNVLIPYVKL